MMSKASTASGSQVKPSYPGHKQGVVVPNVMTTKPKLANPKVNLNKAQFQGFPGGGGFNNFPSAPYESKIPKELLESGGPQIIRLDGDYTPYTQFYLDQLVGTFESQTRNHEVFLIPEMMNQNRFLASPLNAQGHMETTYLLNTNLLRTGQI